MSVDRGKYGSKIHLITERTGLPLSVGISGANLYDSQALEPLVHGIPPIRSSRGRRRRKPGKLHADKGYDYAHLRRWLRGRGITHRIARKGIESSQRLGRHRWTIERTMAWLAGCRRLVSSFDLSGFLAQEACAPDRRPWRCGWTASDACASDGKDATKATCLGLRTVHGVMTYLGMRVGGQRGWRGCCVSTVTGPRSSFSRVLKLPGVCPGGSSVEGWHS